MEPQNIQSFHSTLEREKGWHVSGDTWLYKYQEIWFTDSTLESIISVSQSPLLCPSSSLILLCTNPKCGTTWLKALTFAIVTRSRYQCPSDSPLLTSGPHALVPFLESLDSTHDHNVQNPLLSTHMPYTCLPKSVLDSDNSKIIYIARDPKDAFVSRWHFVKKVRPIKDSNTPHIPLDQAFDLFCSGLSSFGPFWDHTLEYWKACLEHPGKVLFLKYENMMKDPISQVIFLVKFMGFPFPNEEEMEGVPLKIVEMCNFESLSNLEVNKSEKEAFLFGFSVANNGFFRKGKTGDWRNCITQEMADKIDQITKLKFGPYGLNF